MEEASARRLVHLSLVHLLTALVGLEWRLLCVQMTLRYLHSATGAPSSEQSVNCEGCISQAKQDWSYVGDGTKARGTAHLAGIHQKAAPSIPLLLSVCLHLVPCLAAGPHPQFTSTTPLGSSAPVIARPCEDKARSRRSVASRRSSFWDRLAELAGEPQTGRLISMFQNRNPGLCAPCPMERMRCEAALTFGLVLLVI